MIVGIVSKDEHCKTHAKGLTEDGHTVVLLGAGGERIPDHLDVMVCRIGSCSHRGSTVAREWKRKTGRPRPFECHETVKAGITPRDRYSFPSGHTLHSVAFTVVLVAAYPRLAILLLPFTLLVALSRLVLGLHYPSDVVAGGLIGAAAGTLVLAVGGF